MIKKHFQDNPGIGLIGSRSRSHRKAQAVETFMTLTVAAIAPRLMNPSTGKVVMSVMVETFGQGETRPWHFAMTRGNQNYELGTNTAIQAI